MAGFGGMTGGWVFGGGGMGGSRPVGQGEERLGGHAGLLVLPECQGGLGGGRVQRGSELAEGHYEAVHHLHENSSMGNQGKRKPDLAVELSHVSHHTVNVHLQNFGVWSVNYSPQPDYFFWWTCFQGEERGGGGGGVNR